MGKTCSMAKLALDWNPGKYGQLVLDKFYYIHYCFPILIIFNFILNGASKLEM